LAQEAYRRAVDLRTDDHAKVHGITNAIEREAIRAICAYEEALFKKHGRRQPGSRTWQMVKIHGIIGTVERAVNRKTVTAGYQALAEMGMADFMFEAVVLRHPEHFSADAVRRSDERLRSLEQRAAAAP
jgi:hypothetical protein